MRIMLSFLSILAITGCGPSAEEFTFPVLPDGLKDCKAYIVNPGSGRSSLTIIRCPNSATSNNTIVSGGKTSYTRRVIVIDGVTYTADITDKRKGDESER